MFPVLVTISFILADKKINSLFQFLSCEAFLKSSIFTFMPYLCHYSQYLGSLSSACNLEQTVFKCSDTSNSLYACILIWHIFHTLYYQGVRTPTSLLKQE